jgi:ATPase subunit of ABC transporter with duplicated ATPase domains
MSLVLDRNLPRPGQHPSLLDRAQERALLDDFAGAVRRGESRRLVLQGEAGIGKTALLNYLIASTSDLTVLRTAGVESDMELAYAGLHQQCASNFRIIDLTYLFDRSPSTVRVLPNHLTYCAFEPV